MTITRFDRPAVRQVQAEAEAALQAVAQRHGLRLTVNTARFSPATLKLNFQLATAEGEQQQAAEMSAMTDGRVQIGQRFLFRSRYYEVVDFRANAHRYPIIAKRVPDGKRFKFPLTAVTANPNVSAVQP